MNFVLPSQKDLFAFSSAFKNKNRRLQLVLLSLFFLIFPNQNYYQTLQATAGKPPVRIVNLNLAQPNLLPVNQSGEKPPYLTAKAALIVDLPTKTVIYAKNPDLKLLPASTTKIMTALVAADYYQPKDILTVKTEWKIGQIIGFKSGENFTFESLLYSLLVGSENDAANILAENYPGGIPSFIKAMNNKAKALNLKDTNFTNAVGIDDLNHLTTTHDLAILTAYSLKNPLLAKIVNTGKVEISDADGKNSYLLESTNKLLGQVPGVKGVKTGWTENAGDCLVAYTQRKEGEIVTVVLGSNDRFGETQELIEWVYRNFTWQPISSTHW